MCGADTGSERAQGRCARPRARPGHMVSEPAKVFDNLYFVGSKIHSSWALTTSQGIILIDTLYTYNSEEEIGWGLEETGASSNIREVRNHQPRTCRSCGRSQADAGPVWFPYRDGGPRLGFHRAVG